MKVLYLIEDHDTWQALNFAIASLLGDGEPGNFVFLQLYLIIEQGDSTTQADTWLTVTFKTLLFHLQYLFLHLLSRLIHNSHDVVVACVGRWQNIAVHFTSFLCVYPNDTK